MRYAAFIVGILALLATSFLAYRWTTDVLQNKDAMEKQKATIDLMRPIVEKSADLKGTMELATFDLAYAEFTARSKAWPFLVGSVVLGLLGCILVLTGRGMIAALLMFLAVILPAIFHVATLIFTGLFVIAAILSLFVRRKSPAPAPAPVPVRR
jgi:hypothetical protein